MVQSKFLLDSSVIVASYNLEDSQYQKAVLFFQSCRKKNTLLYIHPFIIAESLSILKMKIPKDALLEVENALLQRGEYILLQEDVLYDRSVRVWEYFNGKNNLSFVDAVILDCCLEKGYELVTFDKELDRVYKKYRDN